MIDVDLFAPDPRAAAEAADSLAVSMPESMADLLESLRTRAIRAARLGSRPLPRPSAEGLSLSEAILLMLDHFDDGWGPDEDPGPAQVRWLDAALDILSASIRGRDGSPQGSPLTPEQLDEVAFLTPILAAAFYAHDDTTW